MCRRFDPGPAHFRGISVKMGHHHGHSHAGHSHGDGRDEDRRRMMICLILVFLYMIAEAVGGWMANSLALLADAGHM